MYLFVLVRVSLMGAFERGIGVLKANFIAKSRRLYKLK